MTARAAAAAARAYLASLPLPAAVGPSATRRCCHRLRTRQGSAGERGKVEQWRDWPPFVRLPWGARSWLQLRSRRRRRRRRRPLRRPSCRRRRRGKATRGCSRWRSATMARRWSSLLRASCSPSTRSSSSRERVCCFGWFARASRESGGGCAGWSTGAACRHGAACSAVSPAAPPASRAANGSGRCRWCNCGCLGCCGSRR